LPASTFSSSTTGGRKPSPPSSAEQRRDLLEIIEDRYDRGSVVITSQLPVDRWYEIIGDPTLADAILDRLVHNAYRIELRGESMRKKKSPEPASDAA
jgi:DNA replication protein DnaC